jgi:hypothetical protein
MYYYIYMREKEKTRIVYIAQIRKGGENRLNF